MYSLSKYRGGSLFAVDQLYSFYYFFGGPPTRPYRRTLFLLSRFWQINWCTEIKCIRCNPESSRDFFEGNNFCRESTAVGSLVLDWTRFPSQLQKCSKQSVSSVICHLKVWDRFVFVIIIGNFWTSSFLPVDSKVFRYQSFGTDKSYLLINFR